MIEILERNPIFYKQSKSVIISFSSTNSSQHIEHVRYGGQCQCSYSGMSNFFLHVPVPLKSIIFHCDAMSKNT